MLYHTGTIRQEKYFCTKLYYSIDVTTIVLSLRLLLTSSNADAEALVQSNGAVMRAYRRGCVHILRPGPRESLLRKLGI